MSGHGSSSSSGNGGNSNGSGSGRGAPEHNPIRDMAAQIYVQLATDAIVVSEAAAKITTSPESLAKISFKLAEAFHKAEADLKASAAPVHAKFDADKLDFDAWTSK
ncbi:MAG: hypothetical protein ABL931_05865 [Usitatibacteraceae bacterium]